MDPETVGGLVTAAGGAASAVKNVIEAITAARSQVKGNEKAESKLSETLDLVSDLRSRLFDVQEKALGLQQEYASLLHENAQLREDIRQKEERAADRERYEFCTLGEATVVVEKEKPDRYLCATCFEAGQKTYLSPLPGIMEIAGTHMCAKCQLPLRLT